MSEWRWYVYLMRQCDCILGNVRQQGEYQNKTSNRSIISVSWHHALRRHALETGALISLCTGLQSVLNSDHSHLHSRFPKSVFILFSGKWDVVSGFSECRTWTSSINITGGTGERCKFSAHSRIRNSWCEVSNPSVHAASGGIHTTGGKALL